MKVPDGTAPSLVGTGFAADPNAGRYTYQEARFNALTKDYNRTTKETMIKMTEPTEVLNNDNAVVARLLIHNVGDGVQVMVLYPNSTVKTLLFITGANVAKASNTAIRRRPGGRVAEVKK